MTQTYANRGKKETARKPEAETPGEAQPSLEALRSGTAAPTAEQKGHRVDLPEAMREKMESAFGADLSAVKLYESEAVAEAGANAMAQGSEIAFAPGMLDFSSFGGQALLGHEISHVVSQARGEVTGGGFLNDHALEARADREGAMAAAGQQVSAPTASLSPVSAASAAGPMQADKSVEKTDRLAQKNAAKTAKYMKLAKQHHQQGNAWRAKHYNKKAYKSNKWAKYWSERGDDDVEKQMAADWSGSEVRNDLPIFFQDYYQVPEIFDPANEELYDYSIEQAEQMKDRKHRSDGGYY